jgi:hypothetical protein
LKTLTLAIWLSLAILAIGYVTNNFVSLNDWIDAEMCSVVGQK